MIKGENSLTQEKKSLLKQGTRVQFKWHGSDRLYTGRIEINEHGEVFFVNEHCYEGDTLIDWQEPMRYYNRLDGFYFFNQFDILG